MGRGPRERYHVTYVVIRRPLWTRVAFVERLFGRYTGILWKEDFQLLLLASLLPPLGLVLVSPILYPLIGEFGASASSIGLMISAFTAPSIIMIPIAGALADRYGRKWVLVPSLLLFGAAGTAIAATTDFRIVLGLRALQGVAFGGINPVIITLVGDVYSGDEEATAQGLRLTGAGVSATVFSLLAGVLVAVAWEYPFILYAVAFPVAALVSLRLEEPPTREVASDGGAGEFDLRTLLWLVRQPRILAIVVAKALAPTAWIGFFTFNSIVVVQVMEGTTAEAGVLAALVNVVFSVSASQAGRISTVFDSRHYPLVVANAALAGGFVVVLLAPTVPVAGVGVVGIGVGYGLAQSLYRSVITGLAPGTFRGSLVSVAETGSQLTATLTPAVMGAAIALLAEPMELPTAVRLAGVGAAIVGGGGGIACLAVAKTSPPVDVDDR